MNQPIKNTIEKRKTDIDNILENVSLKKYIFNTPYSPSNNKYSFIRKINLEKILFKFKKYGEEKWNDSFSIIKYNEDPIIHHINIYKTLQDKIGLPKITTEEKNNSILENKVILDTNEKLVSGKDYCKKNPKTLSRLIGESLGKIHSEGIAYRDPFINNISVLPNKMCITYNSFIFSQPIEKDEDIARDIMQFIISIYKNSKVPIEEITQIFKIYYKNNNNTDRKIKNGMKKVIDYDIKNKSINPLKNLYYLIFFGFSQSKILKLKKTIYYNFI